MTIHSFAQIATLESVGEHRTDVEKVCFTAAENPAGLHLSTLAGFLCAKRALIEACSEEGLAEVTERDLVLAHGGRGEPLLLAAPSTVHERFRKICISLSHTADHAVGLAVVERGPRDE